MKITKENNELIVRIPLTQKEANCYKEDDELCEVSNLVGVITPQKWGIECTISQAINMSYCGKPDQVGMPYIYCDDNVSRFKKLCIDLGLECIEYEKCDKCKEAILGTITLNSKGKFCQNCCY